MTKGKAPGKYYRETISVMELNDMFPDEKSVVQWFEETRWPNGRHCPRCGSVVTKDVPNAKPMPYWCRGCKSYFSVRTGTAIEHSRLPLRKWVFAVYMYVTSLKGVSSMKLHNDLKVTQKTAWFMLHRLREAWAKSGIEPMAGPVEADETFMGGKRMNKPKDQRRGPKRTGTVDKTVVAGVRDRETNRVSAAVVPDNKAETLVPFVEDRTAPSATVYTDEHPSYRPLNRSHEAVHHKAGEYVRGDAHTQGIESFWAMLKRAHKGTFHKISEKHLQRYVNEFTGRHNVRDADTIDMMRDVVTSAVGKRLTYAALIADNGLASGARP